MFEYYVVSAGLNWMDANLARLVMTSRDRPPHLRARLIDMCRSGTLALESHFSNNAILDILYFTVCILLLDSFMDCLDFH